MSAMRAVRVDLGFYVADAERPLLELHGDDLEVRFIDINEELVVAVFREVVAFSWADDGVDRPLLADERDDEAYEIVNSSWLEGAKRGSAIGELDAARYRHLKLNFNAAGVLEVLCTECIRTRP